MGCETPYTSVERCHTVRVIKLYLETQSEVEESHFRPPAFAHKSSTALSPVAVVILSVSIGDRINRLRALSSPLSAVLQSVVCMG